MKNLKILGLIGVLMVIIAGVFVYLYFSKLQAPMANIQSNTNPQNLNSETVNWKTYRNDEYSFEIQYPNDWEILGPVAGPKEGMAGFTISHQNDQSSLNNTFRINVASILDYQSIDSKVIVSGPITIEVGGMAAKRYKTRWAWESVEYTDLDYVEVEKDNKVYSFTKFGLTPENIPFDKILSTFKFTK